MEIWKDIPNTHYQVSNYGQIRNYTTGYIIKQQKNHRGYYTVRIKDNNMRKITLTVHKQVALAFCDNPHGLKEVNHEDGSKANNQADNLRWCTRGENIKHAWENRLRHFTKDNKIAVLENLKKTQTPEAIEKRRYARSRKTICVETGKVFKSMKDAAAFVGAKPQNIQESCDSNGRRKSKGYHWAYFKEEK